MKLIILLLFLLSTNLFAANVPVTIKATADNYFFVVLNQAVGRTIVSPISTIPWSTPKEITIHVPDSNLKKCSIDFITFSSGYEHAFAGTITGNQGVVHSGNPVIKTYKTSVMRNGPADINLIYASRTLDPTRVYSPGVWGTPASRGFDPLVKWISTSTVTNYGDNSYAIFSLPCANVVKKVLIANPIPRPKPIPAPKPFPLPIGLKGDHFSCYMLDKGPALKPEQITITDQFGRAQAVLGKPIMLCNPSEKIHNGRNFKISDKKRHLVCYEILEQTPNKPYELEIENQFEKRKVRSLNRELFCVPSLKRHL